MPASASSSLRLSQAGAQPALGRGVDRDAGHGGDRADRSDEHHVTATVGRKVSQRGAHGRERSDEVEVDQFPPPLGGAGRDRAGHALAGRRDDAVEPAEQTRRVVECRVEVFEVSHITGDGVGAFTEFGAQRIEAFDAAREHRDAASGTRRSIGTPRHRCRSMPP